MLKTELRELGIAVKQAEEVEVSCHAISFALHSIHGIIPLQEESNDLEDVSIASRSS